jgi:hypothetical protein
MSDFVSQKELCYGFDGFHRAVNSSVLAAQVG